MRNFFHGNTLEPVVAIRASLVGTMAVCCVTLCLLSLLWLLRRYLNRA
jgi:hypothetical protein